MFVPGLRFNRYCQSASNFDPRLECARGDRQIEGWLIASGWLGFDFTIKRPADFLAALDVSSVKPM